MALSQYTESYLDHAEQRIAAGGRPWTVGTFLAYKLKGRARKWQGRYFRSLERSLHVVGAKQTPSAYGRVAYRRAS